MSLAGRLGRAKAEALLERKPVGSYLVRLGLKIWGYTISVKSESSALQLPSVSLSLSLSAAYTDVKHFLVDSSSSGKYQFLGPKQRQFNSLTDLMAFYRYFVKIFITS